MKSTNVMKLLLSNRLGFCELVKFLFKVVDCLPGFAGTNARLKIVDMEIYYSQLNYLNGFIGLLHVAVEDFRQ